MIKQINKDTGKPHYTGASVDTPFNVDDFYEVDMDWADHENTQVALHTDIGSLTVLDRMTGYGNGIRDTETGFRDTKGNFWLASGMYDVRDSGAATLGEAIEWVKKRANTCVPDLRE